MKMNKKVLIIDVLNIAYSIWVLIVLFFVSLRVPFEIAAKPDITNIPIYITSLHHMWILVLASAVLPKSKKPEIFYLILFASLIAVVFGIAGIIHSLLKNDEIAGTVIAGLTISSAIKMYAD